MLTRKAFLALAASALGCAASGCSYIDNLNQPTDVPDDAPNTATTNPSEFGFTVDLAHHSYRFPTPAWHSYTNQYVRLKEQAPNIYIYAGGVDLEGYGDDSYFEQIYGATKDGFDTSDAFEHFESYFRRDFAGDAFGLDDFYSDVRNPRTEIDASRLTQVEGRWVEHVRGRFACDSAETRFVAYVANTDNEVCCCMAADAVSAQSFGYMSLEDDTLEPPTDEQLEEWARKIAETLIDKKPL